MRIRAALVLLLCLAPAMAGAGVLYKSVDANGIIMFSDTPPPDGARVLEERALPSSHATPPAPSFGNAVPVAVEKLFDYDTSIARASAQVDQAERALALARRELWSPNDGLRLGVRRVSTLADDQRLAPYHKDLKIARRHLAELLQERQVLALRQ